MEPAAGCVLLRWGQAARFMATATAPKRGLKIQGVLRAGAYGTGRCWQAPRAAENQTDLSRAENPGCNAFSQALCLFRYDQIEVLFN